MESREHQPKPRSLSNLSEFVSKDHSERFPETTSFSKLSTFSASGATASYIGSRNSKVHPGRETIVLGWQEVGRANAQPTMTAKVAPSAGALDSGAVAGKDTSLLRQETGRKQDGLGPQDTNSLHAQKPSFNGRIADADMGKSKRKVLLDSQVEATSQKHPYLYVLYLIMEGRRWNTVIMATTIYALFADDFRAAALPKGADNLVYSLSLLAMLLFLLELVVFTICKPGYYKSFYFYLDILATVTMISDVGFIWERLLGIFLSDGTGDSAFSALRASRVGTKSSRIVRIVRLIRLVRVVKLYKASKADDVDLNLESENPSLVGKKLSDKTMQRVIVIVLSMLIFVQFFDYNMYINKPTRGTTALLMIHRAFIDHYVASDLNVTAETFIDDRLENMILDFTELHELQRIVHLQIFPSEESGSGSLSSLVELQGKITTIAQKGVGTDIEVFSTKAEVDGSFRGSELDTVEISDCLSGAGLSDPCTSTAMIDISIQTRWAAALNIFQTIFVMVVLTGGSLMIQSDAERLVIKPIEKMVLNVKELAENPMAVTANDVLSGDATEDDETVLLQRTINKIGRLLQIGFGEAGAEVIATNMANNSGIEPMCDGVKIDAIFGFCDIRNFTDTTECLQEKVMVYVNRVGAIVHEATHTWFGAANKNIGDAFLLVWKLHNKKRLASDNAACKNMADNAFVAFLRSMVDLKRENGPGGCLHEYKDYPSIRKRFGENNFEIRLGMGLHVGWAIEGTIGSKYKIDASYLSPNVNMASRLEAATKQFRTPLLLSEDFYDSLSRPAQLRCRKIDRVAVKGSIQPLGLFTCDLYNFPETFGQPEYDHLGQRIPYNFDSPEMASLHEGIPAGFYAAFEGAVKSYLDGDWSKSKLELEHVLEILPGDGPSISLLEVMEGHDFKAPEGWNGYRQLTEK